MHMMMVSTNPPIMYLYRNIYYMNCMYPADYPEFKNSSIICNSGYSRRLHEHLRETNNTEGT
jgi:hypothetical protein